MRAGRFFRAVAKFDLLGAEKAPDKAAIRKLGAMVTNVRYVF